ncbi:putative lipid phosphate phosphatase beta, partial [Ananas comosus]
MTTKSLTSMAAAAEAASPSSSLLRRLVAVDTALSLRVHSLFLPVPRSLLKALEVSGDGRFWFPVVLALLPLSSSVAFSSSSASSSAPSSTSSSSASSSTSFAAPPRLQQGIGHSSRVFFIASFLHLSSASLRRWIRGGGGAGDGAELVVRLVFLWSAATSASRVLLGRHFVFDASPERASRRRGSHHLPFHE